MAAAKRRVDRKVLRSDNFGIQGSVQAKVVAVGPQASATVIETGQTSNTEEESHTISASKRTARILFLAANPLMTSRLDLEEELRSIDAELRSSRYRDQIELLVAHAARPDDVVRLLRRQTPTIVHFSGHGANDGVVLRNENSSIAISGEVLGRIFAGRGIQLVVLNACFTDLQASAVARSVTAVIGTTDAVDDDAARRFATAFYRTLADGYSVGEAFRDGRDAVDIHLLSDVFHLRGDGKAILCGYTLSLHDALPI